MGPGGFSTAPELYSLNFSLVSRTERLFTIRYINAITQPLCGLDIANTNIAQLAFFQWQNSARIIWVVGFGDTF